MANLAVILDVDETITIGDAVVRYTGKRGRKARLVVSAPLDLTIVTGRRQGDEELEEK